MEEINTVQEVKELNLDELNEVSGGSRGDERHKLRNYIALTVSNLPKGEYLVMQRKPRGAFMSVKYQNGDHVLVHPDHENGYYLAYDWTHDMYGFIDARYVV